MKPLGLTTLLLVGVLLVGACHAKASQPSELVCSGKAALGGDDSFSDQFVVRILGDTLEIRGNVGTLATFDGTVYKICLNSQNEVDFEYGTSSCRSGKTTRAGNLDKVTGKLTLQRFDMGQSFIGTYDCQPAHRVLE
ncbi:hypothetical protein [Ralstonia pickettii]|uniref:hypothetical protein n=1 Tax=Ralstonia pickettii TaxID=329 RepID=UPI0015B9206E|nr:hypothetical protein [Ralstonia pickettii]NWK44789.1 hypothetical protein [Ralstonia pickettii]